MGLVRLRGGLDLLNLRLLGLLPRLVHVDLLVEERHLAHTERTRVAAAAAERAEDVGDPAGRRVVRAGVEEVVVRLVASGAAAEASLVGDQAGLGVDAGVVQRDVPPRRGGN